MGIQTKLDTLMAEAGYEKSAYRIVDGEVIFDQIFTLGTVEAISNLSPDELNAMLEQMYIDHRGPVTSA